MSSDPRATKNRPRRHPDFASFSRIGALVSSIQKGGADPEFSFAPKVFRLLLFLSCLQTSNMISPLERLLGPGRIATDDGQLLCTLNIQTVPDNRRRRRPYLKKVCEEIADGRCALMHVLRSLEGLLHCLPVGPSFYRTNQAVFQSHRIG